VSTRNLTASVGSLMSEAQWGFRVLAHISTQSGTLYLQTGIGYTTIGANTYAGVGHLGGIERIGEDIGRFSPGVKMWLMSASYTNASSINLLTETLNEKMFNRDVLLYRSFFRDNVLVNTPELWFRGKVNEVNLFRGDPERGDYVELEVRTRIKKERKSSFYTREDLWISFSGDTGFDYHHQIPGFKGMWGFKETYFGGTSLPGGGGRPPRGGQDK
jgi:hypothetical protein